MKAESFIYSWSALWLWMQYLSPLLQNGAINRAYTFQKGRLDLEIENNQDRYRLSWQKQGNKALITCTQKFSTPKKRVGVLKSLLERDSLIQDIQVNRSDRALRFLLSNGNELVLGAFPAVLNVFLLKKGSTSDSFFKTDKVPELDPMWISTSDRIPSENPTGPALDFDLMAARDGLQHDPDAQQVLLPARGGEGLSIAELTIHVLRNRGKRSRKDAAPVDKIARNVRKRWERKLKKVRRELEDAGNWEELDRELQAFRIAQAYQLTPTNGRIEITAEQSPDGKPITLKLLSDMSVATMIPLLAKRIRKSREKTDQLPPIIQDIERDINDLEELINDGDQDGLRSFLIRKGEALEQDGSPRTERKPYKKYQSPSGYDILVGRGSTDNDTLTFKVAGKNDWWFHARGVRGSHVVLRCGKIEPEQQDILKAAELAARNSKAQHSGIVVVQYCQRKHVTKPKGSSPGTVLVHQEQTLTIDLSD